MTVTIELPDKSKKKYNKGVTPLEIAQSIGEGLARAAIAAEVNGDAVDLYSHITKDSKIRILTFKDPGGVEVFRHSSAHVLAHAVTELFPNVKPTIGPVVEEGFYYDFDKKEPFTEDDLHKIEKKMHEIVKHNFKIERVELTEKEAKRIFGKNKFKMELIDEFREKKDRITAYRQGDFIDLCRGPHVQATGKIKSFKLTKLAAAYWKGDPKNPQLQRIYGISFPDSKELNDHLKFMEEVEKRDHRKIGKDLELFFAHEWSPGCPFFLPKGAVIYNELLKLIREEYVKRGYKEVVSPQLFNKALFEQSGHWEHYKENMFTLTVDDQEFAVKPMNCPSHILIFKQNTRSYRDLPLRIADFCSLHRNEIRGALGGLTRVRKLSMDDAHVFCTPEQVLDEMGKILDFQKYVYSNIFKFPYTAKLSTRPDEFMGDKKVWDKAEADLKQALEKNKIKYILKEKEGAFYGPKIDIDMKDALGREWQLATIQLDFNMPERMGATYEGKDGKKHTVVMIHRAILGTLERFIGIITEHYAGKFPLWLSPVQVKILTVAERFGDYAEKVAEKMRSEGLRVEVDNRSESIGKKVREAQLEQVNYILVAGEKEQKTKTVTVRTRDDNKVLGAKKVDEFVKALVKEVKEKK